MGLHFVAAFVFRQNTTSELVEGLKWSELNGRNASSVKWILFSVHRVNVTLIYTRPTITIVFNNLQQL